MKIITALEEDNIFKDVQISSLTEEITHKNQKIQELETNLGLLTAVVMDLKQKLEGKFPKEFADPSKESTEERAQEQKEHEEAIDRYIQNPPRTAYQKRKQKMVVRRNVGAEKNLEFGDQPDRYIINTEKHIFNTYGNKYGILSWAYSEENGMFIVKRGNVEVEYYDHSDAFESWTAVDLRG
ncbi:hypothetical protein HanRHA438_Chr13g0582441 [Helianthus annuus]|uniref:Uncharacterized protein n=1 Tax=Helianthus annuus TaxID=4232 RepID=A0A9K3HAJ4_HELAN|nr:hypothetical protein HanXRQr2_Chr13g0571281 [Helianthus annuus]KAJ0475676.1 hypothetical protein HanHA300_Chr13g0468281 [Helianthus annuus]KAJ0479627.1 hypothetical protein HanIR_Chr13g0622171 [Helianthus annuus]KAJ0496459.1 hypothetical protein HanHA89_Chr13g0500021 [Helianthus annuus]KAJ0662516.1 hypothetical protein HanLR1_Chr13g0470431 [Helianthus annuus]